MSDLGNWTPRPRPARAAIEGRYCRLEPLDPKRHGYSGDIAVEPFDYVPDGPGAAARAIGYVRGILEALP